MTDRRGVVPSRAGADEDGRVLHVSSPSVAPPTSPQRKVQTTIATASADDTKDRFARIFGVLELLAPHPDGLTVTEISQQLRLPLSSTHNLLQRLVKVEAVLVTNDLRYSVGGRAVRYGIRIMEGLNLRSRARRHLQELAQLLGEDVYLAERFGDRVIYTDRAAGHRAVKLDIQLGQTLHLHATSVGKLFAAHHDELRALMLAGDRPRLTVTTLVDAPDLEREMEQIRRQGYAMSRQEAVMGIVGLAVPLQDTSNRVVAAIHLSALAAHWDPATEESWITQTTAAAHVVERSLGRLEGDDEL